MKFFNTLSKKKETFDPLDPLKKHVGMYLCGPTVYDKGHLGHARSAVAFDVIRKYLQYKGYKVIFVSNYTDVDDKMIKRAAEEGISVKALAEKIIPLYERDYAALGIEKPDHSPRATEFIPEIIKLIEALLKKDIAYETDDGIYFSVRSFPGYGKLSQQKLEELVAGARVEVNENKRAPEDFALWKNEKPGEPAWDFHGHAHGRPGWHIECSAMSKALLGETFDIHAGGQDLIFPHHEDEIAQSEAAQGKPFARFWLHNGFIRINQEKMSKSLGNFFTIEDVLRKYHPLVVRYFLLSTHYRMPIDFTDDLLEQAKNSLSRLQDFFRTIHKIFQQGDDNDPNIFDSEKRIAVARNEFEKAMDDDVEISRALGAIFDFISDINRDLKDKHINYRQAEKILLFLRKIDSVLAILEIEEETLSSEVEQLIAERNQAREKRDFKRADEIRQLLKDKGIELEDTKDGTQWKRLL